MSTDIRPEISKNNKYHLPKHRYYELKHFCLQYPEWKKIYSELCNRVPGGIHKISESPKEDGRLYVRLRYLNKINLIEDSIKQLDPVIGKYVLKGVTEGYSYSHFRLRGIPCCKDIYYEEYRKFFYILDKRVA